MLLREPIAIDFLSAQAAIVKLQIKGEVVVGSEGNNFLHRRLSMWLGCRETHFANLVQIDALARLPQIMVVLH